VSGPVVSLRAARKRRAREADRAGADANAARHGQTKAGRARLSAEAARAKRALDGARRDDGG